MERPYRLHYLDSLRGIAAIMVVIYHFIERTPLVNNVFFEVVNFGKVGVVAFFILSGMVIPYSFKSDDRPLVSFWVSRFFRLYPAYWFSIFLAVVVAYYIYGNPVGVGAVIINMTMFQSIMKTPDLFGVYWTLIIEMFFYMACSLLFSLNLLSKEKVRFFASVVLLILAVSLSILRFILDKKIPVAVPLCMSLMFFGSIWREVSLGISKKNVRKLPVIWLLMFAVCLIPICLFAYSKDYGHGESALTYIVSYFIGVILTVLLTTKIKITARPFVFMGTLSYSIYLVHPFFLEIFTSANNLSNKFDPVVFAVYLLSVIALAFVSYYLVERPSINFGKKIKQHLVIDNSGGKSKLA